MIRYRVWGVLPFVFLVWMSWGSGLYGEDVGLSGVASTEELPAVPDKLTGEEEKNSAATMPTLTLLNLEGVDAYNHYVEGIHQKLQTHWHPQKIHGQSKGKTVVNFEVGQDGELRQIRVIESSGNQSVDAAAEDAIRSASPFPAFPSELSMKTMVVHYTFDFYKPY